MQTPCVLCTHLFELTKSTHHKLKTERQKSKLVRQSQILQRVIDSSGTVVTQFLTPAQFTIGLYLPSW